MWWVGGGARALKTCKSQFKIFMTPLSPVLTVTSMDSIDVKCLDVTLNYSYAVCYLWGNLGGLYMKPPAVSYICI